MSTSRSFTLMMELEKRTSGGPQRWSSSFFHHAREMWHRRPGAIRRFLSGRASVRRTPNATLSVVRPMGVLWGEPVVAVSWFGSCPDQENPGAQ